MVAAAVAVVVVVAYTVVADEITTISDAEASVVVVAVDN